MLSPSRQTAKIFVELDSISVKLDDKRSTRKVVQTMSCEHSCDGLETREHGCDLPHCETGLALGVDTVPCKTVDRRIYATTCTIVYVLVFRNDRFINTSFSVHRDTQSIASPQLSVVTFCYAQLSEIS